MSHDYPHEYTPLACNRCGAQEDDPNPCPAKAPKENSISERCQAGNERSWNTCSRLLKEKEDSDLRQLAVNYIALHTTFMCFKTGQDALEEEIETLSKREKEQLPDGWYWEAHSDHVACRHIDGSNIDPTNGGLLDRCEGTVPPEVRSAWSARTTRLGFKRGY